LKKIGYVGFNQSADPEKFTGVAIFKSTDSIPDDRIVGKSAEVVGFQENIPVSRQKMDEVHGYDFLCLCRHQVGFSEIVCPVDFSGRQID